MSDAPTNASRLLVVEDEAITRDALVILLGQEGYEVRSAAGGDEAIGLLENWTPDVVVSDVSMRHGDGLSLVTKLRQRHDCRDAAIVLVSSRDDVARRVNALDLGADDFLSKPIDAEELFARIRAHLRSASRRKALLRNCSTDACTHLLNRRGLQEALAHELLRAERFSCEDHEKCPNRHEQRAAASDPKVSLIMADLDGFKNINDQYGHAVGDEVLEHVARCLEAAGRSVDQCARWGGDEFVILLNDCASCDLQQTLSRFRSQIEHSWTTDQGDVIELRCSLGGATYEPGMSSSDLLKLADQAMYRDKRARADNVG